MKKFMWWILFCLVSIAVAVPSVCFTYLHFAYPLRHKESIELYASQYELSPVLVASIINVESSFKSDVVSAKGAEGLMQIMPRTAVWISSVLQEDNFDLKDPDTNIRFGCFYYKYLLDKFSNERTALAAYNAGEGTVRQWILSQKTGESADSSKEGLVLKSVPYKETELYLLRVEQSKNRYKSKFK